jgi:site-specific recombinase XerD
MMFSWLTEKGILAINPAREVKTPKFSRTEGKTPAFSTEEVQKVLKTIDTSHVVGHRDKALLATLAYTFARIGAVVNLKVEDYFQTGKRSLIRFKEKGGKEKEIPSPEATIERCWHRGRLFPSLLQGDWYYELSGERRNSGSRPADCRPRR